jgi:hypothetical protein
VAVFSHVISDFSIDVVGFANVIANGPSQTCQRANGKRVGWKSGPGGPTSWLDETRVLHPIEDKLRFWDGSLCKRRERVCINAAPITQMRQCQQNIDIAAQVKRQVCCEPRKRIIPRASRQHDPDVKSRVGNSRRWLPGPEELAVCTVDTLAGALCHLEARDRFE